MDTGIGQPVRRKEDFRLVRGAGRYSDDVNLPGQAYAVFVRSPHAHARIGEIVTAAAREAPGVIGVLTAADCDADGLDGITHPAMTIDAVDITKPGLVNKDGSPAFDQTHTPFARDKARHVGEAVAMVVAETVAQAKDAAELIEIDYEALPAVTRQIAALEAGAPIVWDEAPGNVAFDAELGDRAATDTAFESAAHVVETEFVSNRIVNAQMEPRATIGEYDAASERYILHAGSQGSHRLRTKLAEWLNQPEDRIRVISHDVGGGFGPRSVLYPEFALCAWAAKRLGRPVKWTCERSEAFVTDFQARDLVTRAGLAFDANGRITAMRVTLHGNVGGNTVSYVPLVNGSRIVSTVYDVPLACVRVIGILTNTLPSIHYRGAGRPQAMHAMERLLDIAAGRMGIDRIELRRRNLIAADAFPYINPTGLTYDCGEFETNMDMAIRLADMDGFAGRRAESQSRGKLRGLGIANFIETPVGAPIERAEIEVRADETVVLDIGTQSQGQGHETSFAQVVSEWLGVPFEAVEMHTGDTDRLPVGGGTHSDRSIRMGGKVMVDASDQIIAKGKAIASHLLEAAEADVEFAAGRFTVAGTDRSIGIFEVARAAERGDVPDDLAGSLAGAGQYVGRLPAYPNGSAVCEVEIDPATGVVVIARYSVVDDVGRVINPMIVHGQTHGGIAQGVGQVLMENCVYDEGTGQLLSGSFMDYCMPRADDLPFFATEGNEVITAGNPLGVKGGGESGTTGALAVVMSAIVDALEMYGITEFQMPATPERVWRAIRDAKLRTAN